MAKKRILFVAYQFPPLAVGGSYRPYKFVKELKKSDSQIEPIVLSLSPKSFDSVYSSVNLDQKAYQEVLDLGIKVYHCESDNLHPRTKLGEFISIYFNVFKGREGRYWRKDFMPLFYHIVKKEMIDAIYVTCPPFSIGELVRKASKKVRVPYIVDMRDNWSLWLSQPHGSRLHYIWNRWLEKRLYRQASGIIAVTEPQLADIETIGGVDKGKFYFIPNSFDLDLLSSNPVAYTKRKNSLQITYAGSFYFSEPTHMMLNQKWYRRKKHRKFYYWPIKERWIYRSPYFFFKLINQLKKEHPEIDIKVTIIGNKEKWLSPMIDQFDLQEEVRLVNYIPREELLGYYKSSNLLLVTSAKREGGKDAFIASKTYEYLQQGKMILGVVSDGAQKSFLAKCGAAIIIDSDKLDEEKTRLIEFAKNDEVRFDYNLKFLEQYSIQESTKSLESVLLSVIKGELE